MKTKAQPPTNAAAVISEAGQTVRDQVAQMQLHYAAREQQITMQVAMLIVTAGAEVLQEEHGFALEDSGTWATETLRRARKQLAMIEGKELDE